MGAINLTGKKRLHFFLDEKVVNDAIINFEEVFPNENIFVILSKDGTASLVKEQKNTLFLSYKSSTLSWLIEKSSCFQEIICHSLWYELDRIICKLKHPNITWVVWGADLFEGVLYRNGYKLYFNEKQLYRVRSQRMPVPIYKMLVWIRDFVHYYARIKAINCIHNICASSTDIDLLKKYTSITKCFNRKSIFYYPIEQMLDEQTINSFVDGSDIWVNNAAGYNGNHVEVFERLKTFKKLNTVHVPLSYGMKKYAKYVEDKGYEMLGNSFDSMTFFMPKKEYYQKFLRSNAFIFGHLRSCAMGNIVVAFYLGAKVFLFKSNPMYISFKEMGLSLFNIEEDLNEINVYSPLSTEERVRNREIIMRHFSLDTLLKVLKDNF